MKMKTQVDYYVNAVREETESKKCSNCFQVKPLGAFYRKLNAHQSRCKACNAEVVRAYNKRLKAKRMAVRWARLRGEI